ncbi:MAG: alpha/beta hydrolase [Bacillota bacterium]|nr:alpha/beta hydrolase [Bacillota bacterium]
MTAEEEKIGFIIKNSDNMPAFVYCWNEVQIAKAVVLIIHGMGEHAGRYRAFAEFLNKSGFIVYANDLRGHGKTAVSDNELGYVGKDGFNKIIKDEYALAEIIRARHPGLPVFLLGHSFGSFIAQDYITRYGGSLSGVILSGSALNKGPEVMFGKLMAGFLNMLTGSRKKSKLLNEICFGSFDRALGGKTGEFKWLTRDTAEIDKYIKDKFCGFEFSNNFFYYFFKGLSALYKPGKTRKIPLKLPVLICSGGMDPVGKCGRSVKSLYDMYRKAGLENIEIKLYKEARHEIINEINREEIFNDIIYWLNKNMGI